MRLWSTQNQALHAILFLYREVLGSRLTRLEWGLIVRHDRVLLIQADRLADRQQCFKLGGGCAGFDASHAAGSSLTAANINSPLSGLAAVSLPMRSPAGGAERRHGGAGRVGCWRMCRREAIVSSCSGPLQRVVRRDFA